MSIDQIINDLIKREGGFVNHPSDRGGPTKFGVTQATLSDWTGKKATAADVQALDKKTAFEIYYRDYYQRPNIDELPHDIQEVMLDMAANMGPRKAAEILQITLSQQGFRVGDIDGYIGQRTIQAAEACHDQIGRELINQITYNRRDAYNEIVKNDSSQQVFLAGWLNRANSFLV